MGFVHCSRCNKLFESKKDKLCAECKGFDAANITKITEFVQNIASTSEKACSINSISRATGVPVAEIERLYRLNKLRGLTGAFDMNCKICGKKFKPTIFSGVCCYKCSKKVEKVVTELKESSVQTPQTDEKASIEENEAQKKQLIRNSGMHVNAQDKTRCGFKKN